jgi:hypothetical protein
MLEHKNLEDELGRFFKEVIKQSRANLTRGGNNASKRLYKEMDYTVKENKNSFEADLLFPTDEKGVIYGEFLNWGVKGVKSGRSLKGFKYTNKKPPVSVIKKWMRVKPIKARDRKTGKFITQEQGAFAIQNAIYQKGIKPTEFYSKPFERAFKKLPEQLVEAYGLDVDDFIEFVIKE